MSTMSLTEIRDKLRAEARKHDHTGELMFPAPDESPFYRYPSAASKVYDDMADAIDHHMLVSGCVDDTKRHKDGSGYVTLAFQVVPTVELGEWLTLIKPL